MTSNFSLPVALTPENGFSLVAKGSHMIEGTGKFYPQRTGHFHAFKLPNLLHLKPTYSTPHIETFVNFQDFTPLFSWIMLGITTFQHGRSKDLTPRTLTLLLSVEFTKWIEDLDLPYLYRA